jgi:GT2 family glycosyltransferase/glycosyltransferase involved in cell wall biosynthesis
LSRPAVKLAFVSCDDTLIEAYLESVDAAAPELELFTVAEFPPPRGRWIPWRVDRTARENRRRILAALGGRPVRYSAILLEPRMPYWRMRGVGVSMAPLRTLFYNENIHHFMLRPRSAPAILRHFAWRAKNFIRWELRPGGTVHTWLWRLAHPTAFRRPLYVMRARVAGAIAGLQKRLAAPRAVQVPANALPTGISVVIPSRSGASLLERLLPVLTRELEGFTHEVIVVDNGSDDGTAAMLASRFPHVRAEISTGALSFARAVNRGIAAARLSHVCLLNNDMELHAGFLEPLLAPFASVPDLFCATAQIFFPAGQRREETGKAVVRFGELRKGATAFPVRCDLPIPGENHTYVLYGSGGCSLYDTRKLRALGVLGEVYEPAYVEDLDAGYRAWQLGWPTVFVETARVTHQHRATTSRYYAAEDLERVLEINFLRFLARAASPGAFGGLWRWAIQRLDLASAGIETHRPSLLALKAASAAPQWVEPPLVVAMPDEMVLGIGSGDVAVFPGRAERRDHTVLIASCYIPFPLSHGGAVRMYNLMRRAASQFAQVLVTFVDELHTPAAELLDICVEVVQVRRLGSHMRPDRGRPDVVEDFDSNAFRAALALSARKWNARLAQLEFTQMAQYSGCVSGARTLLVEHDITIDLYDQLARQTEDYETRDQLRRWDRFERAAWREVDCVIAMSRKDARTVEGARRVVTLANGVDLVRFQASHEESEPRRLLFIGSFAHLPNLLALDFFFAEIWPKLSGTTVLHVIGGSNHAYHYERHRDRVRFGLSQPGVEIEGFVSDVRPAYRRASVVVAPLLASAGTNIKIMEAMAMGKAIVSTPGGVNGLDVTPGHDAVVERQPEGFAAAVLGLLDNPERRKAFEQAARATVERLYDWDRIAAQQSRLYYDLLRER